MANIAYTEIGSVLKRPILAETLLGDKRMATLKETLTADADAKEEAVIAAKATVKKTRATKKAKAKAAAKANTKKVKAAAKVETEAKVKGTSVIAKETKKAYGKTQSCGDDVAKALTTKINAAKDKGTEFASICSANGIDAGRWAHLNFGMQRMNLGNKLRAIAKAGHALVI